jgi:ethanolamine permease
VLSSAVIGIFVQAYFTALTGISGWLVPTMCFVVGCALHCLGVGAAMRVMVGLAALALLAVGVFVVAGAPHATLGNLLDIPVSAGAVFGSRLLPFGLGGVWACLPYAVAGFVGVESIALAAEEARDPIRDVPRGLVLALSTLVVTLLAVLCVAPAAEGSAALSSSDSPLVDALAALGDGKWPRALRAFVNVAGLIGLGASFFSAVFAYSRQVFALSRAGYLPALLSKLNARHAPWVAIIVPGTLAWALSLTGAGDQLYVLVIFSALAAYLFVFAAHIRLRRSQERRVRPYRTPGGTRTAWIGLLLTGFTFIACFLASPEGSWVGVALLSGALLYFLAYARRRLIAQAPEEELALAKAAEAALD